MHKSSENSPKIVTVLLKVERRIMFHLIPQSSVFFLCRLLFNNRLKIGKYYKVSELVKMPKSKIH